MRRSTGTQLNSFHQFEERVVPAVMATFAAGQLTVNGDDAANNIVVAANAQGNLTVTNNGQAVAINVVSGTATKVNLTNVNINGNGGDDTILLDKSVNVLDVSGRLLSAPTGTLSGGNGNDTVTGTSGGF